MKRLALSMVMVFLLAGTTWATQLDYTDVPVAGVTEITAEHETTDQAQTEAIVNHLQHDNIDDSNVTWRELDASSVNRTHLSTACVGALNIDSGAIMYDSQIAFNAISTLKLISTTDTVTNWVSVINGYYIGDGLDTRYINNTIMDTTSGYPGSGDTITGTPRRLEILGVGSGQWFATDIMFDSGAYAPNAATSIPTWEGKATSYVLFGDGFNDAGNLAPYWRVSSDSTSFIVNEETCGAAVTSPNSAGLIYWWTMWVYGAN